jgi:hypothetical protein
MHEPSETSTVPDDHPAGAPWAVRDAARFLNISERNLHRLLVSKKVKSILIGRRRLVPDEIVRQVAANGV